MFKKNYDDRLSCWQEFRRSLEKSSDPIQDAIDFYNNAPYVSISTDPYTPETWPSPWELIQENQYCEFGKLLGICYTLQLTSRFSKSKFEIHIKHDQKNSRLLYLLYIDNNVIGYKSNQYVNKSEIPNDLYSELLFTMNSLN